MIRRWIVALAALAGILLVPLAVPAAAATGTNPNVLHQVSLLAQQHHAQIAEAAAMLFGWLASHATAFLTHENAPPRVKATVVSLLSAVAGVVGTVVWSDGQPWYLWVKAIGFALLASQGAYLLRDIPVLGSGWLQNRGLSYGDPQRSNPTDPNVFPGADGSLAPAAPEPVPVDPEEPPPADSVPAGG